MNWVMGIDPAMPGSETTAAWRIKVASGVPFMAQVATVAYPAPFDFKLLGFRRVIDVPDGCLRVYGEEKLCARLGCGKMIRIKSSRELNRRRFCSRDCFAATTVRPSRLTCSKCGGPRGQYRGESTCRKCKSAITTKNVIRRHGSTINMRHFRYGLASDEFDKLRLMYGGLCPLCRRKPGTDVDHDHQSRIIRGLLCRRCNQALGLLGDNLESILRVVDYLQNGTARISKLLRRQPYIP